MCKAGRGLLLQPRVALGSAFGKLMLQIGYPLRGIGRIIRCGSQPSTSLTPSPSMGEGRGGGERPSRRIPG